jgi:HD-GYP domain-containing protein (c-di-GMP phosphodiesterase class II)/HAMP domain-containing protein
MTLGFGKIVIERRFLRSRVARRIFLSVLLCALLPISSFALLSFHLVTDQLEREAQDRLRGDAKQVGMTVLEKLLLLDDTLRVLDDTLLRAGAPVAPAELPAPLRELARGRFLALEASAISGAEPQEAPLLSGFRDVSPEDRLHLAAGRAWLRVLGGGAAPRIVLAHRARGRSGMRLVAAELDPAFLFPDDALRPRVALAVRTEDDAPVFANGGAPPPAAGPIGPRRAASGGEERLAGAWSLFLRPVFRAPAWRFVLSEPEASVLAPVRQFRAVFPLVALLSALGVGLASLVLIRRQLVPIETLHAATQRVAAHDFGVRVAIASDDEFQDLGRSFNQMAESIAQHLGVMETVNAVGTALSVERDHARLLETILRGAMRVTGAGAGALQLLDADERVASRLRQSESRPVDASLEARLERFAAKAAGDGETVWDERAGALSIPMRNHEGEAIGVLQLLTAPGEREFPPAARALAGSLASQTAVALTRERLAAEFRALFEGLIQLLVKAIDEKSPYTGAHCRRVPILTEMIADAACAAAEGPLKEFTLSGAERYELRIAALLHDCGKVTTPVHVQDKATKLEALCDRIEVVELRFEVVRRDLALARAAGRDPAAIEASLRQLDDDRAFLGTCNTGGEFMDAVHRERVRTIADRWHWQGPDGTLRPLLDAGDVENLSIERGTLNAHEREIINQHVVTTIQMLEQLPYPRSLRNVPFIAGCHHERMDGCGYPNHLTREQMSLQARILGLADVFEALTAKDRPYKPGMRVGTALEILARMRDEGHIDPDLYEVFVGEKVHLRYAARWLDPEQIDEDLLDEAARTLLEGVRRETA